MLGFDIYLVNCLAAIQEIYWTFVHYRKLLNGFAVTAFGKLENKFSCVCRQLKQLNVPGPLIRKFINVLIFICSFVLTVPSWVSTVGVTVNL